MTRTQNRSGKGREAERVPERAIWTSGSNREKRLRGFLRVALWVLALALLAAQGRAEEPPSEEPSTPPPPVIAAADVPDRAAAEASSLRAAAALLERSASLDEIEAMLAERRGAIARGLANLGPKLRSTASLDSFAEIEWEWRESERRLEAWAEQLRGQTGVLEQELRRLEASADVWERSASDARDAQAPEDIVALADSTLTDVRKARDDLGRLHDRALGLLGQVGRAAEAVEEALARIDREREGLRAQLIHRERDPLWSEAVRGASPRDVASNVRRELREALSGVAAVVRTEGDRVAFQLLLLVVLGVVLRRARAAREEEREAAQSATAILLERPLSLALLLTLLATPWLYVSTPPPLDDFVGILLLLPVLRLVLPLVELSLRPAILALGGLYVADQLRDLIEGAPLAASLLFLIEMIAAAVVIALTVRTMGFVGPRSREAGGRGRRALALALEAGLLTVGVAALATVAGFGRLGILLGGGALKSAYVAVFLLVVARVADAALGMVLRSRIASALSFVRGRRDLMLRRGRNLVQVAAVAAWVLITSDFFTLLDPLVDGVSAVLFAELSAGAISLSLADVLAFVVTVGAAVLLARFITLVLDEDVYPRVRLGRGAAYALSTVVRYGVILLGFLFAVGAMGLGMDRITVLLGAFGVGLGFGLQNVVNNFVSGLILIFERPVQVGDSVEVGSVKGTITRIGIRSSTVRTFDGADVALPNGTLLSEALTNWTMSDRLRRIEVSVGVAYGTDPDVVIEALREAEGAQAGLVDEPAPQVLFKGFGESSLDFLLRAWVENNDLWVAIQSDLALHVNRCLAARGIEIPFPQRDLHLRSVAPDLRPSLPFSSGEREE